MSLASNLKHLTWQSQRVAEGDYSQRVEFMNDFSDAFNKMIKQLAVHKDELMHEIIVTGRKTEALEASHKLLTDITQKIPQQIIVYDVDVRMYLFLNNSAQFEAERDPGYLDRLINAIFESREEDKSGGIEVLFGEGEETRYFYVHLYSLEWEAKNAMAVLVDDISAEKKQMKELENYAYRDSMTNLYNRFAGMLTLNKWLDQKKKFALAFADLDNLKMINDIYGHGEGDRYIMTAAQHMKTISLGTTACRVGGDEFMILVPDAGYEKMESIMKGIYDALYNDEYFQGYDFHYAVSFGIVAVDSDNALPASDILSMADERMYINKREMKKKRSESLARKE